MKRLLSTTAYVTLMVGLLALVVWVVINTPAPLNQCPCHL